MYVNILFTNYCECISIITLSLRLKIVIFLTFSLIQSIVVVVVVVIVALVCEPLNVYVTCLTTVHLEITPHI